MMSRQDKVCRSCLLSCLHASIPVGFGLMPHSLNGARLARPTHDGLCSPMSGTAAASYIGPHTLKGALIVAKSPSNKRRKVGMSNHPLDVEARRQSNVPARGQAKKKRGPAHSSGTTRGHRLSRKAGGRLEIEPDRRYVSKSAKGGKCRGSRAGLLSAGRKSRGSRGKSGSSRSGR